MMVLVSNTKDSPKTYTGQAKNPKIIQIDATLVECGGCNADNLDVATLKELVMVSRRRLGLTQVELARRIGVDQQSISNLESGKTKTLKLKSLRPLAEAIGVPVEEVVAAAEESRHCTDVPTVSQQRDLLTWAIKEAKRQEIPLEDFIASLAREEEDEDVKALEEATGEPAKFSPDFKPPREPAADVPPKPATPPSPSRPSGAKQERRGRSK